jgi:uncharacterized cupredoxin-like copper-binding protein
VTRTVRIGMSDAMRFTPDKIVVKHGETVRFIVANEGKVRHELVLGTPQSLKEHYAAMLKDPGMEHDDPSQITLDAGKTGEIVWRFTRGGTVAMGCLQPGHYDAGMKGSITVR